MTCTLESITTFAVLSSQLVLVRNSRLGVARATQLQCVDLASHVACRLVDMDLLADMLGSLFKSDGRTFHHRLAVLRCFRPDNPTGNSCLVENACIAVAPTQTHAPIMNLCTYNAVVKSIFGAECSIASAPCALAFAHVLLEVHISHFSLHSPQCTVMSVYESLTAVNHCYNRHSTLIVHLCLQYIGEKPFLDAGHYELDLVLPHHRAAAQRLVDAAAAEGEQPTWRNLVWEDLQVPSSAGPPESWGGNIPTR